MPCLFGFMTLSRSSKRHHPVPANDHALLPHANKISIMDGSDFDSAELSLKRQCQLFTIVTLRCPLILNLIIRALLDKQSGVEDGKD